MTNSIRKSKNRVYRDSQRRGPCYPPVLTLIAVCILVSGASGAVFGPLGDPAFNDNQGSATTKSQSPLAAWGVDYLLACGARPDGVDQTNYDVLMYDIFLKIPKGDPDYIIGRVTCIAEITTDNTGIIAFDFAEEQIMQIDAIYSPDGPLGYNRVGEVIFVALDSIHQAGDTVEITTEYRGEPAECGIQGFRHENSWRTNSLSCTSSLSQPSSARSWWPCKDRPDDKADSFKIAIQVPTDEENNRIPISNGRHDGVFDTANTATYVFTVTHPMATYLFGVAIYPYKHVWQKPWVYNDGRDTMPVYFYAFDYDRDIEAAWNLVPSMLDWMSDWFGLYPFRNEKYGHAHFQSIYAMEHQTIGFFPRYGPSHTDIVDTGKIVHELAHQWWGNMITCASWHHSWLNEGWAKWAEALWLEQTVDAGEYRDFMADLKCFDTTRSVYVEDTTWIIADVFYEPLVYNKGAWVIHMLRHKLGDSLFRQGIKEYYDFGIEGVSATTEDMRDVFALATDMDLVPFFQQWIYDTGYPVYEWYYTYQPDLENDPLHERVVQFHVEQMDEKGLQRFEMPVDFEFNYKGGGSDTFTFNVDSIDNFYAVSVPDSIESIVVDPGGWVLHEARKMEDWRQEAILTRTNSTDPTIALSHGIVDSSYVDTIYTTVGVDSCDFTLVMDNGEPENFLFDDTMGIISITMCVDTGTWDFTVTAKRKSDGSVIDMATLSLVIEPALSLPEHFVLHANYPNPFNPSTLIEFDLPRSAHVSIDIYNVLGQKVRSLINREYPAGFGHTVEWHGDNNSGRPVATGVYFYRMESEGWVQSRKMLLLR